MLLTIEAIYENERVTITIQPAISLARETAGMIPWTADAETLESLTRDPEFGTLESP
jgi:hypothetical protein